MPSTKINKNVILVVALIVVGIVGYFIFKSSSKDTAPAVSTVSGITDSTVGQELVIELNRLKGLQNVDDKFLTEDPVFTSLFDFTQPVPEQPVGRENPFAPIGSDF